MEPSRTRTERDLAAAQARARPSTQYAAQYPTYPEQAQQLRARPSTMPPAPDYYKAPQQQQPVQVQQPAPRQVPPPAARPGQYSAAKSRGSVLRRVLGVLTFFVLTGASVPLHILAVFFVYVQVESPGDAGSAVPLLGGLFAAVFLALFFTGLLTQLVGGFPGRWRARVTFSFFSGAIALAIAYAAAITQFR